MYYSRLLNLKGTFQDDLIDSFDNFLAQLSVSARSKITISKVMTATGTDYATSYNILDKCAEIGLLKMSFAIRCPECGFLLGVIEDTNEDISSIRMCYRCEQDITISIDSVQLIYSLQDELAGSSCIDHDDHVKKKENQISLNKKNLKKKMLLLMQ